jgi:lysozyme
MMNLRDQLIAFEGFECSAYPDPLTGGEPWTIGVGHCGPEVSKDTVWDAARVNGALDNDIEEKTNECRRAFTWFDSLNEPRQAVIIGMCFQMGLSRLLKFKKMLAHVADDRFPQAAGEMRSSVWAHQTPKRAIRLAAQLESGEWC